MGDPSQIFANLVRYIGTDNLTNYQDEITQLSNINYQDIHGQTLLHICVNQNSFRFLVCTLSHGANIDVGTLNGLTPLNFAIWKGFIPLAATLLKAHANPNTIDDSGRSPLFFAVRRGDIHAISLLLSYHADPNVLFQGKSLLYYAALAGYPESIKLLIDHGADTTLGNPKALLACLRNGNRECFSVLIKKNKKDVLLTSVGFDEDNKERPILQHALEMEANLLPVLAKIAEKESQKHHVEFPPKLKKKYKKKLQTALKLNDHLVNDDSITSMIAELKNPWKVSQENVEN